MKNFANNVLGFFNFFYGGIKKKKFWKRYSKTNLQYLLILPNKNSFKSTLSNKIS